MPGHFILLSQVHYQETGLKMVQPGAELMLKCSYLMSAGIQYGLIHCTAMITNLLQDANDKRLLIYLQQLEIIIMLHNNVDTKTGRNSAV